MSDKLYPIKLYILHKPNLLFVGFSILVNILTWLSIIFQIRPQDEPIFLHYNILFGVDYIGDGWQIFLLPVMGLIIVLVNFVIGWSLFSRDKFVSLILGVATLLCQIFLFVASAILIFLNA